MIGATFKIFTLIAAAALIGTAGATVVATAHDTGGHPGGHAAHAHDSLHGLHGSGHHERMAALIEELELTRDQRARLDRIHELLAACVGGGSDSLAGLHDELVAQFAAGPLETAPLRRAVDAHLEQMRIAAYEATDELAALVNGLDDRQRGILHEHLAEMGADVR